MSISDVHVAVRGRHLILALHAFRCFRSWWAKGWAAVMLVVVAFECFDHGSVSGGCFGRGSFHGRGGLISRGSFDGRGGLISRGSFSSSRFGGSSGGLVGFFTLALFAF